MSKCLKIVSLIQGKTRQLSLTLSYDLVELFKKACKSNNTKPTKLIEMWIIDYLEKNQML